MARTIHSVSLIVALVDGLEMSSAVCRKHITLFHSKLFLYNCKFHNVKDEHLDIITSLILLMLTMLPFISSQLQADSVLQSMPLLLHWAIMAQDKTPKRGCR